MTSKLFAATAKSFFDIPPAKNVLHNYFDGPIKLFSDLYLAKVSDTSAKLFSSCNCQPHRTILLKDLKFCWIQDLKIILDLSAKSFFSCTIISRMVREISIRVFYL